MGEKYIVYAAGKMGVTIKRYAQALKMNVVAFYDNNLSLQGKQVDNLKVFTTEELNEFLCAEEESRIIIGSPLYQKELYKEIRERFGTQVIVLEPENIQKRYWDEIVSVSREQIHNEYNVTYKEQVQVWLENIMSEVEYWVRENAASKGKYHEIYINRLRKRNTAFHCERLNKKLHANSIVIDAGCGICSQYGNVIDDGELQLIPIDPLAYFYNTINKKSIQTEDLVQFGLFEFLSSFVGKNYADVILIDNALDHCIDPFKSVIESLAVLKVGGILSMKHRRCEAVYEGYTGLHKWNIDINDANEFIIWNEQNRKNVSRELRDIADVEVIFHEKENRSDESIDVNIIKRSEFDIGCFYGVEEEYKKLAQVIEGLMKLVSMQTVNRQFDELLKEL